MLFIIIILFTDVFDSFFIEYSKSKKWNKL